MTEQCHFNEFQRTEEFIAHGGNARKAVLSNWYKRSKKIRALGRNCCERNEVIKELSHEKMRKMMRLRVMKMKLENHERRRKSCEGRKTNVRNYSETQTVKCRRKCNSEKEKRNRVFPRKLAKNRRGK